MTRFYSNGKLLLTGEYVVLDGAKALALPTQKGQSLQVENISKLVLEWKALLTDGTEWFSGTIALPTLQIIKGFDDNPLLQRLIKILQATHRLNPYILNGSQGYSVTTRLDFHKDWGLGSSSTLINNIASWAQIDPYELLALTFGGSGYDIACAKQNKPLTYMLNKGKPQVQSELFDPPFKKQLFFIYRNQKQNSRQSIAQYRDTRLEDVQPTIKKVSEITEDILKCNTLSTFERLMEHHEDLIASLVKLPTIGSTLFADYTGGVTKSLGGWGGDFILATGKSEHMDYFRNKGYTTIIPYTQIGVTL